MSALLDPEDVRAVLARGLAAGGDFAEVFGEESTTRVVVLDDGRIENVVTGFERGVGVRVVRGDTTGYAHTATLTHASLLEAAAAAAAVAAGPPGAPSQPVAISGPETAGRGERHLPDELSTRDVVAMLRRIDGAARSRGAQVTQVQASWSDKRRRVLVANSNGAFVAEDQVRCRPMVHVTARGDAGMQTGFYGPGETRGVEYLERIDVEDIAARAADEALRMLAARPAPTGKIPVVVRKGGGGVLVHEACGHGLEADAVQKGASVYAGRRGDRVAPPGITIVDDATFEFGWGSYAFDDEGTPAQRNTLIADGVLEDYMWDTLRARKEGRPLSGNGRRQSYKHAPMVRMTNTLLLPGIEDPDEIVAQTPYGLYAAELSGGSVNTATGDFVFGVREAWLIENGELTHPVRGATLIGNGPDCLAHVDALASDFEIWTGTCGKDGQAVPVYAGTPTMRVSGITVGGTAA